MNNSASPGSGFRWASIGILIGGLALLLVAIQFIPVRRTNPPVTSHIQWDSPQTEALLQRACMDCHSNETRWPWYSSVAPASWLLYYDVERGRSGLNLSAYVPTPGQTEHSEAAEPDDLAYWLGRSLASVQAEEDEEHPGEHNLGDHIQEVMENNSMPPAFYTTLHPQARLTQAEREQLTQGLIKSLDLVPTE